MVKKAINIAVERKGRTSIWSGSLEYLENSVFGYTLECGHSWNNKISRYPKTKKSLVNALNKSAEECRRYNEFYYLVEENEIEAMVNAGASHNYEGKYDVA